MDLEAFSRQFCRLVVQFERRLRTGTPGLPASGVTDTPGLGVLVALDVFGPLRPTTLATLLGMTTGGATKVVDRVAARGLVTRRPGSVPADRRAVVVTITPRGRRAIAAADVHLRAIGDDFVQTIDAITEPAPPVVGPSPETDTGRAVGLLYRFFGLVDPLVIEVVGEDTVLHPNDPRGLLVLLELDRHGALLLADVPALIDRGRAAVHRLVRRLRDLGLVTVERDARDRRMARLVPTRSGHRVARRIVRSLDTHLPELEPVLVELASALRDDDHPPSGSDGAEVRPTRSRGR